MQNNSNSNFWFQDKPLIGLAPMDGVTDFAFRHIVTKYAKPDLLFTEFTSVEGICAGATKMLRAFIFEEEERPIIAQLFGITPNAFYKSTILAATLGFDGVDINMGCPAKGIATKGSGAGLITTPQLAREIIKACKRAATDWANGTSIEDVDLPETIIQYAKDNRVITKRRVLPISVKTRIGYNKNIIDEWISNIIEEHPTTITVHGRTLKQMYTGKADWEAIAKAGELCKQAGIKVLGNGDIQNIKEAYEKITQYNLNGVLIGRATLGNPWIFNGTEPTIKQRLETTLEHAQYYQKIVGTEHFTPVRKHLAWYCRGFNNASDIRLKLIQANSAEEVQEIITETLTKLDESNQNT